MRHSGPPPSHSSFTLAVKVVPGAPANRFAGCRGEELVVKIAAQPEKGKANKELVAFVATSLGIAKSDVVLLRGETSHHKLLRLPASCRDGVKKLTS